MLIYGASREISAWVSYQLFNEYGRYDGAKAIGVASNGKIICGVCYDNFSVDKNGRMFSCEMSIASVDKRWATRHNLKAFFSYPFSQLQLDRVWTQCSADKGDIVNFNKRLGFKQEGIHRGAWPMGGDSASFGMLKTDCKWVNNGR